jgi:hypothetical protein
MMKKLLTGILGLVGVSASSAAEPQVQMIDPSKILFSMSTISDASAPIEPLTGSVRNEDFVIHEDEWRQVEFFPSGRLEEIKQTLEEFKAFEKLNRESSGWRKIYLRKLQSGPVVAGPSAVGILEKRLDVRAQPAPILFHGSNVVVGRVAHGFSLPLGGGVVLYGYSDEGGVQVLAANLEAGADDLKLTGALVTLNANAQFFVVDWRSMMIATSASGGKVAVWRP